MENFIFRRDLRDMREADITFVSLFLPMLLITLKH